MKNPGVNCIMLLAIALVYGAPLQSQDVTESMQEKIKNFAQKHKEKIIAGGLAAIDIALGVSVALVVREEAENAIKEANIKPGTLAYEQAMLLCTTFGPFGYESGIHHLVSYLDPETLAIIVRSEASKALAYYWKISWEALELDIRWAMLAPRLVGRHVGEALKEAPAELKHGIQVIKNIFGIKEIGIKEKGFWQ